MHTDRAFLRNTVIMVLGAAGLLAALAWFASHWAPSSPTTATGPSSPTPEEAAPIAATTITSAEQRKREAPLHTQPAAPSAAPSETPAEPPPPAKSQPALEPFVPAPYMPPPPDWKPPPGWTYTPPLVVTADGGIGLQNAPILIPGQAGTEPSPP